MLHSYSLYTDSCLHSKQVSDRLIQNLHNTLVLTAVVSLNDASSVLHFRSALWHPTNGLFSLFPLCTQYHGFWPQRLWVFCNLHPYTDLRKIYFHLTKSISFSYYILFISSSIQNTLCDKLWISLFIMIFISLWF